MYATTTLAVTGYRNEPVPHTFLRQNEPASHAALLCPGMGYSCDLPLLYYPTRLLLALGADVLRVEYAYQRRDDYTSLPAAEQMRWLFADVTAACQTMLDQRPYQQVTLVGKSLGTLALGHLLSTDARLAQARAVWLTPLLGHGGLGAQVKQWGGRSLFVIGTADPYYDAAALAAAQAATAGQAVVVPGADHSMEIPDDLGGSLEALTTAMRAVQRFLA